MVWKNYRYKLLDNQYLDLISSYSTISQLYAVFWIFGFRAIFFVVAINVLLEISYNFYNISVGKEL